MLLLLLWLVNLAVVYFTFAVFLFAINKGATFVATAVVAAVFNVAIVGIDDAIVVVAVAVAVLTGFHNFPNILR